jgi:hypothetical protein
MRFGAQDNAGIMRFGAQDNGIMRLAPDLYYPFIRCGFSSSPMVSTPIFRKKMVLNFIKF